MSPRQEVVERKLAALSGYVEELRPKTRFGLGTYRNNATLRRAVERLLQLCVEAAVDACAALAAEHGRNAAATMRGDIEAAAALGAIPEDLAERLGTATGLRNRLVHDYERLDDAIVWAAARSAMKDLPLFIGAMTAYLEQNERR